MNKYDNISRPGFARLACLLLGAGAGAGCRPDAPPAPPTEFNIENVSGTKAMQEVEDLIAIGPRDSGTPGAECAAVRLFDRLRALDIAAEIDAFSDPTPIGPLTFRNVLGRIPGAGPDWVVIASHFDTKSGVSPDFIGANDSGSSTGLLLELARVLRAHPAPPYNLLLAFLDGEECLRRYGANDGLHGSRRLARQLRDDGRAAHVRAVIVIDMIGDRNLNITLPRNVAPALGAAALRAAEREGARGLFRLLPHAILDDHQPFLDAGMPALVLIDFEYGSAPGLNDHWHTPADTMDNISADSLRAVGRLVIRILNDTPCMQIK